ncbi:hypothetical protein DL96DRAFT_1469179 [Flagelloscypha sp. PMI_526]|nr:hypothetical protein DL96DRAFT_1469179 [Flagelloscypha sp. PMI_526]
MPPIYTGSLAPKKKGELQDIASSLGIVNDGTKEDLTSRIKKHLDDNPELEEDSRFAGLYGRGRKRSAPPPSQSNGLVPTLNKRTASRTMVLPPLPETPERTTTAVVLDGTPSSLPPLPESTAPSLSVVQRLTAIVPSGTAAKFTEQIITRYKAARVEENSSEMLQTSRTFLSNSLNIWSLTALTDLALILYYVIPWKYTSLRDYSYSSPIFNDVQVPYPPSSVFYASAFYSVLIHWALPSLVIPSLFGFLISFNGNGVNFDPLTASIMRLAAQIAWTFPTPASSLKNNKLEVLVYGAYGLDVLGQRWRVLTAGVALLFAFAEQISKAPAFAGGVRKSVKGGKKEPGVIQESISTSRRLAIEEAGESSEVD